MADNRPLAFEKILAEKFEGQNFGVGFSPLFSLRAPLGCIGDLQCLETVFLRILQTVIPAAALGMFHANGSICTNCRILFELVKLQHSFDFVK